MNPRVPTAFFNQYLSYRQSTWHSVKGYIQSFCRDDETIKITDCVEWNKEFYNTEMTDLADEFKPLDAYWISLDNDTTEKRNEQVNRLILQHKLTNAYIYIIGANNQLYCTYIQDGKINNEEEKIMIKPELIAKYSAKKSEETDIKEVLISLLGEKPNGDEMKKLSMDKIDLLVANTNHIPFKQIEAWVNLFYKLGDAAREQLVISSTKHAVRTYAIQKLKTSDRKNILEAFINQLRDSCDKIAPTIADIEEELIRKKAKNIEIEIKKSERLLITTKNDYHQNLLRLCDLGDDISICRAAQIGLFSKLTFPNIQEVVKESILPSEMINKLNPYMPYYYQSNHYLIHFQIYYFPQLNMNFEKFEKKAKVSFIIDPKEQAKTNTAQSGSSSRYMISTLFSSSMNTFSNLLGSGNTTPTNSITSTPQNGCN